MEALTCWFGRREVLFKHSESTNKTINKDNLCEIN